MRVSNSLLIRIVGGLSGVLCLLALFPACVVSIGGMMAMGDPTIGLRGWIFGLAVTCGGPLALSYGMIFGFDTVEEPSNRLMGKSLGALFLSAALYSWAWLQMK